MNNIRARAKLISRHHQQLGATLVEALVSLVVFAVGALGIAALQTTSMVRVEDTKQRSIAIWKAQELADRMRSSITRVAPNGNIPAYVAAIGNNRDDIGMVGGAFVCPAAAPTRCDDVSGTAVGACAIGDVVAFDIWSVMCDPNTGLALQAADGSPLADGNVGLRDVELALDQTGGETRLYLEWQSRSANSNQDLSASGNTVTTNLCGEDVEMDSSLDAYCLKIL